MTCVAGSPYARQLELKTVQVNSDSATGGRGFGKRWTTAMQGGHKIGAEPVVLRAGCAFIWMMSGRAQKLLGEALNLTDEERAEVARELVASLDDPKDADAEGAWIVEIERRARHVLAEPEAGEDWASVRAEIESKLRWP